jgi:hypothetical protein
MHHAIELRLSNVAVNFTTSTAFPRMSDGEQRVAHDDDANIVKTFGRVLRSMLRNLGHNLIEESPMLS